MPKIRIDKELYEELKKISENAGYSSAEEFVSHVLERVVNPPITRRIYREELQRLAQVATKER